MGTFDDTITAAVSGDSWCTPGAAKYAGRPSDPQGLYDDCVHGSSFLQYLNIANAAKCLALWLQSLQELADALPAGEQKTRLEAQAQQTANLATDSVESGVSGEAGNLIHLSAIYLNGGDTKDAFAAFRCFARAHGQVNGIGVLEAEAALATLWKSRCTVGEWGNGLS